MVSSFRWRKYLVVVLFVVGALVLLSLRRPHPPSTSLEETIHPPLFALPQVPVTSPENPQTGEEEQQSSGGESSSPSEDDCPAHIARLRDNKLGLSSTILYTRRCIRPIFGNESQRNAVSVLRQPLINRQAVIDLNSCAHGDLGECEALDLQVPPPPPAKKYTHLVFGVATTYSRIQESLSAFSHWLADTDALLVALVVDAEPEGEIPRDLQALEAEYLASGIRLRCAKPRRSSLIVDQHHFAMIEDMFEAVTPNTTWLGIMDDDTFVPSLENLDQELSGHDHSGRTWLGALSDDAAAIRNWGVMAFGGAGTFLSVPLAQDLVPHIDECLAEQGRLTGDTILGDCISSITHTKLTVVRGLYQHDIRGDVSGFYESGVQPLTLHHWKSWYREPMVRMAAVGQLCGDCFLQRWRFGNDTLLANGYSITRYPSSGRWSLPSLDLSRTEATWERAESGDFTLGLGPIRPRLPDLTKKSYKLHETSVAEGDGVPELRQLYVHRGNEERHEPDEVVELVWKT